MPRSTVDGRPVFLRRTRRGWRVKWGWTVLGFYPDLMDALLEIAALYAEFDQ